MARSSSSFSVFCSKQKEWKIKKDEQNFLDKDKRK